MKSLQNDPLHCFARRALTIAATCLLLILAMPAWSYTAQTSATPGLPIEELEVMLVPLTKTELEAEAAAWLDTLKQQTSKIAQKELFAKKADPEQRKQANQELTAMRLTQTALVNRLKTVLLEWEEKGGDPAEYRLYANAVSGAQIDIADSSTALMAITAWMKSDEGGLLLLINLIKFAVAMIVVFFLANLTGKLADRLTASDKVSVLLENFVRVVSRRIVLFIGFIVSLSILGINVGPVLALIGAAGLVVGLALQGTLSNFASGVLILIYRPYDVGDFISAGGISGKVDSMTLLSTTIKTPDNQHIVIPNNSVWGDAITNVTGSDTRRVDMVFGIAYDEDYKAAKEVLKSIITNHPMVLEEPAPNIRLHQLADSSVNLICRPWVKTADYWDVFWDVHEAVKTEFDAKGISIPFPQQDVHLYPAGELTLQQK